MLLAALRDLQWRRKRFVITVVGTTLVFALSLVMSGLSNAFRVEIDRTLDDQRAEAWIAPGTSEGAFSPGTFLTAADVLAISLEAAPAEVAPFVFGTSTTRDGAGEVVNVNVLGVVPGGLGAPVEVEEGHAALADGTAVVPERLGLDVGDTLRLGGRDHEVVGIVDHASLIAGTQSVTLTLGDAQRLLFGGEPLVSMVLSSDPAPELPAGFTAFSRDEVEATVMRPLDAPVRAIDLVRVLLWLVAALVVASVVYLTVLERTRDIAVFKATGAGSTAVGAGICLQAVVLAVVASVGAIVVAGWIAPRFPMDVVIPTAAMVGLPVLAVAVGVCSGLIGVRRAVRVEPALAFGGP